MEALTWRAPRPTRMGALGALVRAELTAMSRQARAVLWTAAVPGLILLLGEAEVPAAARGSTATWEIAALAVTAGVFALGFFGYATALAAARERGVFDRLRCAPIPAGLILVARLIAQLVAVLLQGAVVWGVACLGYGARPWPADPPLAGAAWVLGGLCALALGQLVVAWTRRADEAVAVSRIALIAVFLLSGVFVPLGRWPSWLRTAARWSPVGLVEHLLTAALVGTSGPGGDVAARLLALLAWTVTAAVWGLLGFRWDGA
jgi:ABC-2 type transport system permease protein